jgi:hypothetical protein
MDVLITGLYVIEVIVQQYPASENFIFTKMQLALTFFSPLITSITLKI